MIDVSMQHCSAFIVYLITLKTVLQFIQQLVKIFILFIYFYRNLVEWVLFVTMLLCALF